MELFIALLCVAAALFVKSYNAMQALAQEVKKWHANIMATLTQYAQCINKLQELLQGYVSHEQLVNVKISDNLVEMTRLTAEAMARFQNLVQSYPELKADKTYLDTMQEVKYIQQQISQCRYQYNEAVSTYNGRIKSLPENLFAGAVGFHEAPFYDPDKLVEAKNFNTDDGTLVREMILKGTKSTVAAVKNATDTVSKKINEAKEQAKDEPKQEEPKQEEE